VVPCWLPASRREETCANRYLYGPATKDPNGGDTTPGPERRIDDDNNKNITLADDKKKNRNE
jgi:hypothetical protein